MHHERLWQQSKQEAIQAVSAGFAERLNRMRQELTARDATASSIARYFEELVADLTDRVHRDPKTRLMNFRRFIEQLEAFLALEQRGQWCAIGLVDITAFKSYNDTLGHALGDKIIDRVARLLREQIRSDDLIAKESVDVRVSQDMHARFGGDEFCFLIPDLVQFDAAEVIAERFREAVERCDWSAVDPRLAEKPVNVDVGVVCLLLGSVHERRPYRPPARERPAYPRRPADVRIEGAQLAARVLYQRPRSRRNAAKHQIPRNFPPRERVLHLSLSATWWV